MSIEQIKQEVLNKSSSYIIPASNSIEKYMAGANHVLDTYYSPLEASHRELLDVISGKIAHPNRVEEILSNAKKLINDTDKD